MQAGRTITDPPDLAQRVSAINDMAKTARALLTSMAAVALALAATMIAATDEAIFRDSTKVFPSLSVEIRLSTAFALAPPIFVFLHLNTLLQLHLLTHRLRAFLAVLDETNRDAWLLQVHGLSFIQLLLPDRRNPVAQLLQRIATWISVVALPVLLLLAVQVSFVRYQSWIITISHMLCLSVDMALLMWFQLSLWPTNWKRLTAQTLPGLILVAAIMSQAVPPTRYSRWSEDYGKNVFDTHVSRIQGLKWTRRWLSLPGAFLINTDAKPDLLKPLILSEIDRRGMQSRMLSLSLPDRNFVGIDLEGAELFGINLEGSNLFAAKLMTAHMAGANLRHAQLRGADLSFAQIQGVNLSHAQLQGAVLSFAEMQGADLSYAHLQGAELHSAEMQGADLKEAAMDGADLNLAKMQLSNLNRARLSAAEMNADLAHASGGILDCSSLDIYGAMAGFTRTINKGAPIIDRSKAYKDLTHRLLTVGLPKSSVDKRLNGDNPFGIRYVLGCADNEKYRPIPSQEGHDTLPDSVDSRKFWLRRRQLACDEAVIAEAFWRRYYHESGIAHFLSPRDHGDWFLARPPEADCLGLQDIPSDIRRQMDTLWANLSLEEKRWAGGE